MDKAKEDPSITAAQVEALVKKLELWGKTLPADEKQVLEYMLQRIEGVVITDSPSAKGDTTVSYLTETVLSAANPQLGRSKPWVRGGPAWIRSAS